MRFLTAFFLLFFLGNGVQTFCQSIQVTPLQGGNGISIRGLSVVDNQHIWLSGNKGMVAKSQDGGIHFDWIKVPGFEKRDFRDIEAFDAEHVLIMAVDAPAIILKTNDGGMHWKQVLTDSTQGMFLDAMDFEDEKNGIVIGDPIEQKIYLRVTNNQGDTWQSLDGVAESPTANIGEAFFASSGTNIKMHSKDYVFVSGGFASRLYYQHQWYSLPLKQGLESTGANSIALSKNKKGIIVGGDFKNDSSRVGNSVLVEFDEKLSMHEPRTAPWGYRSCVQYINDQLAVCVGSSGVDISKDGGENWVNISKEGYHTIQKAKKGNAVFLAGGNGKIAQLRY